LADPHAPYAQWSDGTETALAPAATAVVVSPSSLALAGGAGSQLAASATGSDGLPLATAYAWTTSVPEAATVSPTGYVTASGGGVTTVRATATGGAYGESTVAVGTPLYLIQSGGAYVLSDTGPATAALVYGGGIMQVDSNPAASGALKPYGVADGAITEIYLST
jgi:hypothetical protein